jgi:hypothetical protein
MNKPGQDKPPKLTWDDGKNRDDREASMRAARLRAESEPPFWNRTDSKTRLLPRSRLIERMRALLDRLDTAQNAVTGPPPTRVSFSKIVEECERTAGTPALEIYRDLLQSYLSGAFERTLVFYLTNSAPDQSGQTGLPGYRMRRNFLEARAHVFSPDREKEATALFEAYLAPCWVHRAAAVRWLGAKGYSVPPGWKQTVLPQAPPTSADQSQTADESDYYNLPAQEPPGSRESAKAYRALKGKYPTMQIPRRSIQELADYLPGNHSRDAVARALGLKK